MGHIPFACIFLPYRICHMNITDKIAANLAQLMVQRGLNNRSLADRSGLNETAVRDILKGRSKNPTIGTLSKMADALNVPLESLWGVTEDDRISFLALMRELRDLDDEKLTALAHVARQMAD